MKWKLPPPIKIYEAIGAIADNRVKIERNEATVSSSSGKKFYTVKYDANSKATTPKQPITSTKSCKCGASPSPTSRPKWQISSPKSKS